MDLKSPFPRVSNPALLNFSSQLCDAFWTISLFTSTDYAFILCGQTSLDWDSDYYGPTTVFQVDISNPIITASLKSIPFAISAASQGYVSQNVGSSSFSFPALDSTIPPSSPLDVLIVTIQVGNLKNQLKQHGLIFELILMSFPEVF